MELGSEDLRMSMGGNSGCGLEVTESL